MYPVIVFGSRVARGPRGKIFPSVLRSVALLAVALCGARVASAASPPSAPPRSIEAFYQPFRVQQGALAPDGQHVAFVVRGARGAEINIFKTDHPDKKVTVPLRGGEVRVFNWISPNQLLVVLGASVFLTDSSSGKLTPVDTKKMFTRIPGPEKYDLYRVRSGARVFQAPDDPAVLLFESSIPVGNDTALGGATPRANVLELHRLNVLTGEFKRLFDYDVESSAMGVTITDRKGDPRIVLRPAHFVYRTTTEAEHTGLAYVASFFTLDVGWRPLGDLFADRTKFYFGAETSEVLGKRTIPLGFDFDPNIFYYASNFPNGAFGIYGADVRTGAPTGFAIEVPGVDLVTPGVPKGMENVSADAPWKNPPLIFDRRKQALVGVRESGIEPRTRWMDVELTGVQREAEKKLSDRRVQLLEWDDTRERFLLFVRSPSDPGRYFVFHRTSGRCVEFLSVAPELPLRDTHPSEAFAFTTAAGVRITGYLTVPRTPGKVAPPLVISLHGGPWEQVTTDFDRDAQALATMGFAVAKLNYRGSTGFGLDHLEAVREQLDTAPVEDVLATLEWIRGAKRRVDLRRVGLLGESYGGYLALRALQLHPETFQSAVAINGVVAPLDLWAPPPPAGSPSPPLPKLHPLVGWLLSRQSGVSVARHPELITKPVFLLHDPRSREAPVENMEGFRNALRRLGRTAEWREISGQYAREDSVERARTYRRIGEFFNLTLNEYAVRIGEVKEKED
jgi:pimeloyl-ACP methyl ester carboxylesterase